MTTAAGKLLAAAKEANERLMEATAYVSEDDEVGNRVCCMVVSYNPHTACCPAVRLAAAITDYESQS